MLLLKKLSLIITLILITVASAMVWAKISRTLLVLDMQNVDELPRNFRSSAMVQMKQNNIDWRGVSDLHIAGGGQFSEMGLKKILQKLNTDHVMIIDLRQESHGFLDGNAISWYGPHDAANAGKSPEQIRENQANRLAKLNKLKNVKVYKIVEKTPEETIAKTKITELPVREVTSEAGLLKKYNLNYQRIFVQDFHAPESAQVDQFIQMAKQVPAQQWIYFHCRAGVGRTTTFMAMYDMMHNAKRISFNDILVRQSALGGKDFNDLPERSKWKYKFAIERIGFLKKFYEYARLNNDNFKTSWTEWVSVHNK